MNKQLVFGVLAMSLLWGGCQKDEFASAPGAEAGATSQAPENRVVAPATRSQSAGKLPSGAQMPPSHPPVGQMDNIAPGPSDKAPRPQFPVSANKPSGTPGSAGPLLWTAPEGWRAVKPSSTMRLAEYHVAGKEGEPPSVMSIFFFGAQGGGGVEANIDRWVGQFKQADGSSSNDAAKRSQKEVNGMKVHLVDVSGNYDAGAAMMGGGPKSEQRMLGAIVEAPKGLFFFKLLGDKTAISTQEEGFNAFVESMKPGQ